MSSRYPALPRQSVRDSFDEDDLSDVDDEVFIRDGKSGGLKLDDEGGVKRPLMAPRRKLKTSRVNEGSMLSRKALVVPFCYGLLALLLLMGLIVVCVYTVNLFPIPLSVLRNWLAGSEVKSPDLTPKFVVPCTSLTSKVVWTRTLPKFTSEAPFRANDVNGDKVDDIIVGFSTGLDAIDAPEYLCDLYFGGLKPCLGGIMALDGKTGDTIWIYWTSHAIFNVDCPMDMTNDGVNDCVITGRGGIFHAVDGNRGINIWKFQARDESNVPTDENILDVYDAACVSDVDGDDVGDIIASHTVQNGESRSAEIIVISGKTGNIFSRVDFPRNEELFIAPRPLLHPDGEIMLVVVSNTPEKSGGLYVMSHSKLVQGHLKLHEIYWGNGKGILLPPILIDVTSDGQEDIIIATVNATIAAFDGLTLKQIWNYTVPNSEVISIPIPGYYNDDEVPDFMVKHQIGPGYPVYYYTIATMLNGKTGQPILEKPIVDSLSGQMSGLTINVDDYGNDWYLHWSSNCLNHENSHEKYRFLDEQSLLSQSRADLCKLIYNTTLITRFWALSQHVEPPGQSLYYSEDWKNVEYNNSIDPREQADEYANDNYDSRMMDSELNLVSERSPRFNKQGRKNSNLRKNSNFVPESRKIGIDNDFYNKEGPDEGIEVPIVNDEVPDGYDNPKENYENYGKSKNHDLKIKSQNEDWMVPNWQEDDGRQSERQYDAVYDDVQDDPAIIVNDVREQRNSKFDKFEFNKSESNYDEKYDSNMDYTNGANRRTNFDPDLSNSFENLPSNSKESIEKIVETKKRRRLESSSSKTKRFRRGEAFQPIDDQYANIENVFKRESMRNYLTERKSSKKSRKWKKKRDQGTILSRGIQRQPPTGILLPSLSSLFNRKTIDLVFSTYWLPPSQISLILLQRDLDCISAKRTGDDARDKDDQTIMAECLATRGIDYKIYRDENSRENARIPIGQMTVYRMQLECACPDDMLPGMSCKNISGEQSWSAHLGRTADGFFRPLRKSENV